MSIFLWNLVQLALFVHFKSKYQRYCSSDVQSPFKALIRLLMYIFIENIKLKFFGYDRNIEIFIWQFSVSKLNFIVPTLGCDVLQG